MGDEPKKRMGRPPREGEPLSRIALDIPESLHRQFSEAAWRLGKTQRRCTEEALRDWLAKQRDTGLLKD